MFSYSTANIQARVPLNTEVAIMRRAILCALAVAAWIAPVAACIASMRPAGGFCSRNPAYQGPASNTAHTRRKRWANPS
jgi:hypothetical protein